MKANMKNIGILNEDCATTWLSWWEAAKDATLIVAIVINKTSNKQPLLILIISAVVAIRRLKKNMLKNASIVVILQPLYRSIVGHRSIISNQCPHRAFLSLILLTIGLLFRLSTIDMCRRYSQSKNDSLTCDLCTPHQRKSLVFLQ